MTDHAPQSRCLIASSHGRSSCATCGESWSAAEAHVCPKKRVVRPLDPAARAVLVAMLTRCAPLIDSLTAGPFVRGWGGEVSRRSRDRLRDAGLIAPDLTRRHVLLLTEAGRNLALNAVSPETRAALDTTHQTRSA